jgi:hypothetical protein
MSTRTTEAPRDPRRVPRKIKKDDGASNQKPSGSKLTKTDINTFTRALE